jgi:hypothetical protein
VLDQMVDVGDHHHAVAGGDAEQRDEADDRGDRQHAAGNEDADDAADDGQRQVEHHQQRIAGGPESDKKQQEDADNDGQSQEDQDATRLLGALELAAVLDVIARRQLHLCRHPAPDVVHHAGQVAPCDVGHDHHLALHVLARDVVRRPVVADVGQAESGSRAPPPW